MDELRSALSVGVVGYGADRRMSCADAAAEKALELAYALAAGGTSTHMPGYSILPVDSHSSRQLQPATVTLRTRKPVPIATDGADRERTVVVTIPDISDQAAANEALASSGERFRTCAAALPDAFPIFAAVRDDDAEKSAFACCIEPLGTGEAASMCVETFDGNGGTVTLEVTAANSAMWSS